MAKRIRQRFLQLTLLQGGQYLASLILLPLLTRSLGLQGYGEMAFCIAMTGYLGLVVEWGYGVSAMRAVAIHKDDAEQLSLVFWSTFYGRLLLLLASALLLALLSQLSPDFLRGSKLLWLAFGMVVANGLAPHFFFQGIEKPEIPLFVNLASRYLSIPLVLAFVHSPADTETAQAIVSLSVIAAALINLYLMVRLKLVGWAIPSFRRIMSDMLGAAPLFLSMAAIGLFTNSLTMILGYVSGAASVGAFMAALGLYKAAQGVYAPLYQVVCPKLIQAFSRNSDEGIRFVKRIIFWQVPGSIVAGLLFAALSPWALPLMLGTKFVGSVLLFQWMCLALVLNSLSNLIGNQLMVALNYYRYFTWSVLTAGFISLLGAFFMNLVLGDLGSVLSMILFETILLSGCLYSIRKNNPYFLRVLHS